jgi:orotidine 5'-phosphate decarboxylase subfamily 1
VLKTHIDIIEDFSDELIYELLDLSKKHDFLIFEDRKFIDIGNIVKLQCFGKYKIMDWADLVSVSPLSGIGVIDGISEAMKMVNKERGIMILAQMSTNKNLADENYTRKAIEIGNKRKELIAGYICSNLLNRLKELDSIFNTGYVIMVPGIKIFKSKDNFGQRYFPPEEIIKNGADCIIVGRGIYESNNPIKTTRMYRNVGWKAYLEKIKN